MPKASIDSAIARGQGKSISGAVLESMTVEAILPSTIALIIEVETDNRNRTLQDLRTTLKAYKGTVTPTNYLFQKRGRVVFEKDEKGLGIDEVLEDAIEAGAEDVELDDGHLVVWTEPNMTIAAAQTLRKSHGLEIASSDIIWDPKEETLVPLQTMDHMASLAGLADALHDDPTVQGVYANVAQGLMTDEIWGEIQGRLDG